MGQKVRGTMLEVKPIDVGVDTVYVRANIIRIETPDFTGWEYDETQYKKDDYIAKIADEKEELTGVVDDLVSVLVAKGVVY